MNPKFDTENTAWFIHSIVIIRILFVCYYYPIPLHFVEFIRLPPSNPQTFKPYSTPPTPRGTNFVSLRPSINPKKPFLHGSEPSKPRFLEFFIFFFSLFLSLLSKWNTCPYWHWFSSISFCWRYTPTRPSASKHDKATSSAMDPRMQMILLSMSGYGSGGWRSRQGRSRRRIWWRRCGGGGIGRGWKCHARSSNFVRHALGWEWMREYCHCRRGRNWGERKKKGDWESRLCLVNLSVPGQKGMRLPSQVPSLETPL